MSLKLSVCILGASGYTGAECYRILSNHPNVSNISLVANANAGFMLSNLYSCFENTEFDAKLLKIEEVNLNNIDIVFCCLPHGQSQKIIIDIYKNYPKIKIIDLSADFRFNNTQAYDETYNAKHLSPSLQSSDVVYGLSEIASRDELKNKRIISCPGCYPTSIIIPLKPLMDCGLVDKTSIIADSKSGISGAGRKEAAQFLFTERSDNIKAYGIFNHRHAPEINEKLGCEVIFTPHLVPMTRGIESTIYADLTKKITSEELSEMFKTYYRESPFVKIVHKAPSTADVKGTNQIRIFVQSKKIGTKTKLIISSVIDNICKGSSGQAVQNMNLAFGFEETAGLNFLPLPV